MRPVRALAFHAKYACRHTGACCSSGWPIPVEADGVRIIETAARAGRMGDAHRLTLLVRPAGAPAATPALLPTVNDTCAFRHDDPDAHCAVHRALGHDALPLACRQFPRITVHDPRGISVTLSHYCPTAAHLIGYDRFDGYGGYDRYGTRILVNPPGFPGSAEYVGLDAREALPPLLRPDLLMDWESWWRIEELAVETLLGRGNSADEALALVRGAVHRLDQWRPDTGVHLQDEVDRAFERSQPSPPARTVDDLVTSAMGRVPAAFSSRARWDSTVRTSDNVTRKFLAAHAFANWRVHERDGGLAAWLRSVETAHAFLSAGAGVRQADLVLRHLVSDG